MNNLILLKVFFQVQLNILSLVLVSDVNLAATLTYFNFYTVAKISFKRRHIIEYTIEDSV